MGTEWTREEFLRHKGLVKLRRRHQTCNTFMLKLVDGDSATHQAWPVEDRTRKAALDIPHVGCLQNINVSRATRKMKMPGLF